jgi:NDP-sugar pyrophosphorylase family protein
MQAIILAAGKGTRMKELTKHVPKPMLLIHGKPVLGYIFESLPASCDEVILIVGYLQEKIREHFGETYQTKRTGHQVKITYVEQKELNGTAGALWQAKEYLRGAFLVMNGDDICEARDVKACADSPDWAMLVQTVDEVGSAGKVVLSENGCVADILEKEVHGGGVGLANTANFFKLDTRAFQYPLVLRPGSDTEYGLPQTVVQAAREVPIHPIETHSLIRLTDPEDVQRAEGVVSSQKLAEIGN